MDTLNNTVGIAYQDCSKIMLPTLQRDEEDETYVGNFNNGRRRGHMKQTFV